MNAQHLSTAITFVIDAHANHPIAPRKAFRKWNVTTPYSAHPIWCGMCIAHELTLPNDLRERGTYILLFHDVLEDTSAGLPKGLSEEIVEGIQGMTFESFDEEMELVWGRTREIRLLKLYDKVSNLLDGNFKPERRKQYIAYTRRLLVDVLSNYGDLNITRIATAICES